MARIKRGGSRKRILIPLLGGALCLLGLLLSATWFRQNFERVDEAQRSVSPEARRNPYLAAERFLRARGTPAESVSGLARLHELPPVADILVIDELNVDLGERLYRALLDWIRAGGHLIVTPGRVADSRKSGWRLFDELGVSLTHRLLSEDVEQKLLQSPVAVLLEPDERLEVYFNPVFALSNRKQLARVSVSSTVGFHLLQIPLQRGLVTILSDNRFLKNPAADSSFSTPGRRRFSTSIAEADHAYYLSRLTAGAGKVWLVYDLSIRGLGPLLWQKARLACISLALLVIVGLWAESNRFGPYVMPLNQPRRSYLEHIKMTVDFCWKEDRGQRLLATNRRRLRQYLSLKHPQLSTLPEHEQCLKLAGYTGMGAGEIRQALFGNWQTDLEFIRLTHALQTLRKKL